MNYTSFNKYIQSDAIQTLLDKRGDGTIREFIDDWRWIFSFSARYKGIIVFYTLLGLLGSSLSLVSAWISRLLINIVVVQVLGGLIVYPVCLGLAMLYEVMRVPTAK